MSTTGTETGPFQSVEVSVVLYSLLMAASGVALELSEGLYVIAPACSSAA